MIIHYEGEGKDLDKNWNEKRETSFLLSTSLGNHGMESENYENKNMSILAIFLIN